MLIFYVSYHFLWQSQWFFFILHDYKSIFRKQNFRKRPTIHYFNDFFKNLQKMKMVKNPPTFVLSKFQKRKHETFRYFCHQIMAKRFQWQAQIFFSSRRHHPPAMVSMSIKNPIFYLYLIIKIFLTENSPLLPRPSHVYKWTPKFFFHQIIINSLYYFQIFTTSQYWCPAKYLTCPYASSIG